METFEILLELPNDTANAVGKTGADRLGWHKVATEFQFVQ